MQCQRDNLLQKRGRHHEGVAAAAREWAQGECSKGQITLFPGVVLCLGQMPVKSTHSSSGDGVGGATQRSTCSGLVKYYAVTSVKYTNDGSIMQMAAFDGKLYAAWKRTQP